MAVLRDIIKCFRTDWKALNAVKWLFGIFNKELVLEQIKKIVPIQQSSTATGIPF